MPAGELERCVGGDAGAVSNPRIADMFVSSYRKPRSVAHRRK
jgi:hypothetical protein